MGRRKITPEFYDALVDAFRETPGNPNRAAATVREVLKSTCDHRTAARAWDKGWPKHGFAPVMETLAKEAIAARAAMALEAVPRESVAAFAAATSDEAVVREQARIDAIRARTEEGKLVRCARSNVLALLESSEELLAGYRKLAPKVREALSSVDVADLDPEKAARLLWRIAISSRAAVDAGMRVLQAERLLLGQPMEIIGVRDMDMDESDVLEELEEAAVMAARVRERLARREGRLRLLQGGRSETPDRTGHGGNGATGAASSSQGPNGKGST